MSGSFIDILPPEAQQVLGGVAILVIASGIVVWAAGVKIARFSVAMLLGIGVAALGAWLLPKFTGITIATGGIVGFVIGALAGALAFRLLQGLILALCLGVAVGGMYYRWHIQAVLASPPPSPTAANVQVPASDLLIHTDRLGAGPTTAQAKKGERVSGLSGGIAAVSNGMAAIARSLSDHWNAIPRVHQQRLLVVSIGTASIALLIAFGFPRATTWVITALLGALMILSGVHALLHVYAPQYEGALPFSARWRYVTLGVVMVIGMGIQYRFFPRKKMKAKAAPPADAPPVAAVPTA
ncbi:MAG: hypothetical protein ACTHN5_06015 [Phycisphaerae bacterium]